MFRLRFGLDLYAGIRPVRLYPGCPRRCATRRAGIDYVIVRENVEGLYAGRHGGSRVEGEVAADTSIVTRAGTRRIVEHGLRARASVARRARGRDRRRGHLRRQGERARLVRVLPRGASEVAARYPDVAFEAIYVDAAALYLVQRPSTFDVLVTENMFGDILSDLGAGTVGGLGLAPSGDVGDAHGLFQAAHGSAPDIAGKGRREPDRHDPLGRA